MRDKLTARVLPRRHRHLGKDGKAISEPWFRTASGGGDSDTGSIHPHATVSRRPVGRVAVRRGVRNGRMHPHAWAGIRGSMRCLLAVQCLVHFAGACVGRSVGWSVGFMEGGDACCCTHCRMPMLGGTPGIKVAVRCYLSDA